jgi:hypothetical protein
MSNKTGNKHVAKVTLIGFRESAETHIRANCLAAERLDPCWKIHQKLLASIVPIGLGGFLRPVLRLR